MGMYLIGLGPVSLSVLQSVFVKSDSGQEACVRPNVSMHLLDGPQML